MATPKPGPGPVPSPPVSTIHSEVSPLQPQEGIPIPTIATDVSPIRSDWISLDWNIHSRSSRTSHTATQQITPIESRRITAAHSITPIESRRKTARG